MGDRPVIDAFSRALIENVRDRAIASCDALLSGRLGGAAATHWQRALTGSTTAESVHTVLPDIVDRTLFELLDAIDNGTLPLAWVDSAGSCVPLDAAGDTEMAGWLIGAQGWIDRFSQQRSFDPTANRADPSANGEPAG